MIRAPFGWEFLCAVCVACSSSSSDPSGASGNAGGAGNASCPDVSGAWDISEHCDATLIGMSLQVTEDACALSFASPFNQFSGSVTADGKISLSGPQSCTGTATASAVSMNCSPGTCVVKLSR
ncbi:MAG TPA: hypothetical protein VGJ91_22850 [Polyangiaceae bacterium]|jgi:hypothetical protein